MRLVPSVFLLLVFPLLLTAQENGWEISASLSPQLNRKVSLVNAYSLRATGDIPITQTGRVLYDTMRVNGIQRIFEPGAFGTPLNGPRIVPSARSFWYGASLQVHRRIGNGFDFSAGLYLNEAKYVGAAEGEIIDGDEAILLYDAYRTTDRSIGALLQANYHLFPEKKLHPYFGMGIYTATRSFREEFVDHLFAGEPVSLEGRNAVVVMSRENTTFNVDFMASAGLLYQLTPNWAIGFDFKTIAGTGHGQFGFQVRRKV